MKKTYNINDIAFDISSLAIQAIMYEVTCYPSPGLVSPVSNGAHKDMDYYTFIESTSCLIKHLTLCVQKGLEGNSPKEIFSEIRKVGISAEEDMFKKTNGVNTHKGMLFLMGVCCAAIGMAIKNGNKFLEIKQNIKNMTEGIVERELQNILENKHLIKDETFFGRPLSYGEKLFLEYNIKGIRGEVEDGLPIIFDFALDFYKSSGDLDKNDRLIHTLIGIMQYSDDTNILHRHSFDILQEVREKAINIIKIGGMKTDQGRKAIELLDKEFIERNISPGGSADLLAVTVFLYLAEEYMGNLE